MTYLYTIRGSAANNLATLLATTGALEAGVPLWQSALDRNEDIGYLGINLILAEFRLGKKEKAMQDLQRVLVYVPDSPIAKRRLHGIQTDQETCYVGE